jgi:hypothetical protein
LATVSTTAQRTFGTAIQDAERAAIDAAIGVSNLTTIIPAYQ